MICLFPSWPYVGPSWGHVSPVGVRQIRVHMRTLGATLGSFGAILGANLVPSWAILWVIMSLMSKCLIRRRLRLRFLLLFCTSTVAWCFPSSCITLRRSLCICLFAHTCSFTSCITFSGRSLCIRSCAHIDALNSAFWATLILTFSEEAFASVHVRVLILLTPCAELRSLHDIPEKPLHMFICGITCILYHTRISV